MILPRRHFLVGLGALFAAPAIVRASSLMQVRPIAVSLSPYFTDTSAWFMNEHADFVVSGLNQRGQRIDEFVFAGQPSRGYFVTIDSITMA